MSEEQSAEKDAGCTCTFYVVDYSDPERYHPENVDREDDPNCPFHGPSCRAQHPGAEPSRTVERLCCWCQQAATGTALDRTEDGGLGDRLPSCGRPHHGLGYTRVTPPATGREVQP